MYANADSVVVGSQPVQNDEDVRAFFAALSDKDDEYRGTFSAAPILLPWFLSQVAAGALAYHNGWNLIAVFFYGLGGIFSLVGTLLYSTIRLLVQ